MNAVRGTVRACRRRRGYVMVTMILSLTVLLSFLGLGIDVGYEEYVKTRMQAAADAAAVGGAQELRASGSTNLVTAAKGDAAANGFTDGSNGVAITVNNPPATGYSTADSTAVEVLISQSVPTFFMELIGISSGTVRARSVARLGSGPTCFYALDPAVSGAFSVSGGVTVQINCGVAVDSSSATALSVSGGSHATATYFDVTGNATVYGGSSISPAPVTGVMASSDPFSSLPKPSVGGCDYTSKSIGNGNSATLSPGTYCKGIAVNGGSHVTFNPGTYILKGGGLVLSNGSTITGAGVTFFNTAATGYSYGAITLNGGTTVTLSAPTTGSLAGILFFQDPSVGAAAASSFSNGASAIMNGTLYFPTTALTFMGGSSSAYTIIVADTVNFSGGATLNNNYSSLPGGSPVKGGATLSE
jgi:Flp pilus assembly protein TadG